MNQSNIFEYTINVTHEHIDELDHVNNVVYVQFMQEVANNKHWHSVALSELEKKLVWVVRRHEIDYLHPAILNDVLLLRTWTGDHSTVSWERHYEIVRISDQKKIITAKSIWVLLDKLTNRPVRIPDAILNRFSTE